jgi:hypothetical protein
VAMQASLVNSGPLSVRTASRKSPNCFARGRTRRRLRGPRRCTRDALADDGQARDASPVERASPPTEVESGPSLSLGVRLFRPSRKPAEASSTRARRLAAPCKKVLPKAALLT